MENLKKIMNFLHTIEKLKSTLRFNKTSTGRKESTAEHSWRLALLAFLLVDELELKIDTLRALKIALVHDIAEAIAGDVDASLVANGTYSQEEKDKSELEAMNEIQKTLPDNLGKNIRRLWDEYNEGKTQEAKFIKALDKIETLIQIVEMRYDDVGCPDFTANYADKHVLNYPQLKGFLSLTKEELQAEFERVGFEWKKVYDL